jgi:ParB family chromosome partitioning protein
LIWKEKNVLIDGHTRVAAAEEANVKEIPFLSLTFETEEDAIEYAIRHNSMRRAVTAGDKFRCMKLVDVRGKGGGDRGNQYTGGKVASGKRLPDANEESSKGRTAKLVGISGLQVSKMRMILDYCDDEDITAVENDEMTVDAAWKEAKEIKKKIEEEKANPKKFNRTNDNIKWALWTWNPITGCK